MNKIAWQSLNYEFSENSDDEFDEDDLNDLFDDIDDDLDDDDEDEFDDGIEMMGHSHPNQGSQRIIVPVMKKIIQTPLGFFDISNQLNPFKNYELWIMHTNFNISNSILLKLSKIPGVELVKPYGRYRCVVGIGKLFSFREVRKTIESEFCKEELPKELSVAINECKQYKYWGVCMMPNGYIEKVVSESMTPSFEAVLVEFNEAKKMEALVFTHELH
jgi:hypothetical protein